MVCPAKRGTQLGNRIRARRYRTIFRNLGFHVDIKHRITVDYDIAVILHAYRNAAAVVQSKRRYPDRPVVLAITGTDLYRDGRRAATLRSLELADHIVVSQPTVLGDLPGPFQAKASAIFQSAHKLQVNRPENPRCLRVIVAGHLRAVKDPFRTAKAVRGLPTDSRIVVEHYGAALLDSMTSAATAEMSKNPRYRWLGEIPRGQLRRKLAQGWLMVLSSKMEGGANVLSEAVALGTPVLATDIAGTTGLLGEDYPGLFEVGDTSALKTLLRTCETDVGFYRELVRQVRARAALVHPNREQTAWSNLFRKV